MRVVAVRTAPYSKRTAITFSMVSMTITPYFPFRHCASNVFKDSVPVRCTQLFFLSLGRELEDYFFLSLGKFQGPGRAAPVMENAGDHHIALTDHPLVAPDDGIPPGHLFQRWVGGAVIAVNANLKL